MSTHDGALAYGTWPSPITAADVARGGARLTDVCVAGDTIYWVESRPAEGGRHVIVRHRAGVRTDVLPAPHGARSQVHEYGGGALAVLADVVYFVDAATQALHRLGDDGGVVRVTGDDGDVRFADLVADPVRSRILAVRERHTGDGVINDLVAIDAHDGAHTVLASGHDFYAAPRVSADGARLAFVTWDDPQMPWDGTDLWTASFTPDGAVGGSVHIAGGVAESVMQPRWGDDDALYFVSDRSGFWNVYRHTGDTVECRYVTSHDCAKPQWVFGLSSYAPLPGGGLVVCRNERGTWRLGRVADGEFTEVDTPFSELGTHVEVAGKDVVIQASGPHHGDGLHRVDLHNGNLVSLWTATPETPDPTLVSTPEPFDFATPDGATGHAFLYRPRNGALHAPDGESPPLLVRVHGGPTAACSTTLSLQTLFWTTRGFAVCDVNYGGSSGYGRAYRERLRGQLGCVDLDDCVAAATHLADSGEVDGARLCMTGGSAGGYVVLCAAVFTPSVFAALTSAYGICDLETLMASTHKFEARYFDSLIGPYETHRSLYHNRSPVHFASRIQAPLLLLQGLDDAVVPPAQAEQMLAIMREDGIPHVYVAFAGEGHGFRRAENIVRALETELAFYARVLGFDTADELPDVTLEPAPA